jgi:nucleotide-binding universal stress UspA family protein
MKKILVAFNAINYSSSLAEFALKIAKQTNSVIHAVFLTPKLAPVVQYPFPNDLPLASSGLISTGEMEEESKKLVDAHFDFFRDDCAREGVECKTDPAVDITLDDLIDHSAFSDLILCDAKEELGGISTRELLVDTHCPVVLVPANMQMPVRLILCYDESFSSILAMKMYSYLFPEWKGFPATVLSINPKGDNGLRFDDYLSDWLPQHFSNLEKQIMQGNLQRELVSFIRKNDEPAMVVMGAYGRNAVSRLFHRSLANIVIEETNAFLFIMHE